MTCPTIDCGHSSEGRIVFMFYLSEERGMVCLCQMCCDRLKGAILQGVLNEMMAQAAKRIELKLLKKLS